jgi:hypothetical protein
VLGTSRGYIAAHDDHRIKGFAPPPFPLGHGVWLIVVVPLDLCSAAIQKSSPRCAKSDSKMSGGSA